MKSENKTFTNYTCLILCLLAFFLASCSGRQPQKPDQISGKQRQFPDVEVYKQKSDDTKISLVKILISEAEKFLWQNNHQDALFVYNQALIHANEFEKPVLLTAIENALERTPAKDIHEFSNIKNIQIPKSLLLYWLGINYGLENNTALSKQTLQNFLYQYPDHRYAADARELVQIIEKTFFNKETIGCLLPLSGKYAIFGQRALTGIQLAIQELSLEYSRPLKLIVKDTQADPAITIRCVQELGLKNVAGIIGPLLNVQQAGQEAQKLKIPLIALTQKDDFPLQGDYLFSNFITPQMQVRTLGSYLFGNLGIQKVAILYPNEKYGKKYMNLFWDITDEYGGQVVGVESYDGSKTDFALQIKKLTGEFYPLPEFMISEQLDAEATETEDINEQGPLDDLNEELRSEAEMGQLEKEKKEEKIQIDFEALFIPDSPSKVKLILPQLAFNDASGMYLVGTNLWHNKSLLKDAKGYNKQAIIADGFFDGSRNPSTAKFTMAYKALFGETPKFLEAISYDTATMMFSTAMKETVDSRLALRDGLKNNSFFEGVTGNTSFDENGSAHRDLFLMTIKKGRFVEISR